MTQKEKIARAAGFAHMVKSVAGQISLECRDYDETWALKYSKQLVEYADDFLKKLSK